MAVPAARFAQAGRQGLLRVRAGRTRHAYYRQGCRPGGRAAGRFMELCVVVGAQRHEQVRRQARFGRGHGRNEGRRDQRHGDTRPCAGRPYRNVGIHAGPNFGSYRNQAMSNKLTRAVDTIALWIGWIIEVPPKGAYAVALVFMFIAYAIHEYQVREYAGQVQDAKYEKAEQHKLDSKTKEEQPLTRSQGC